MSQIRWYLWCFTQTDFSFNPYRLFLFQPFIGLFVVGASVGVLVVFLFLIPYQAKMIKNRILNFSLWYLIYTSIIPCPYYTGYLIFRICGCIEPDCISDKVIFWFMGLCASSLIVCLIYFWINYNINKTKEIIMKRRRKNE